VVDPAAVVAVEVDSPDTDLEAVRPFWGHVVPVGVEDTKLAVDPVVHLYTGFAKAGVLVVFPGHVDVLGHCEAAAVHIQGGTCAGGTPVEEGNFLAEGGSLPVEEGIHPAEGGSLPVVVVDLQHLAFHHPLNKPACFCPRQVQKRIQGYSLPE